MGTVGLAPLELQTVVGLQAFPPLQRLGRMRRIESASNLSFEYFSAEKVSLAVGASGQVVNRAFS
jgi:hypothetical protein